jgi:teichuronic acid biosynthesis glycosyltransferase TuaG
MLLSVIIPFYNEVDLIGRAVASVVDNCLDLISFEIIISNDGPIEASVILQSIQLDALPFLTVLKNHGAKGPGGARNSALDASTGECIAFLDADDFWLPGKVDAQLAAIQSGASFVVTAYRFDIGEAVIRAPESIFQPLDVFLCRGLGTSTVMVTRALLADLRFKDIRFAQDIDFWYALASSTRFQYAAVDVCSVVYSTSGSTKNKWVQLQYLHKVLQINDVPWLQQVRVLSSYVLVGVYNHYIKHLFARARCLRKKTS